MDEILSAVTSTPVLGGLAGGFITAMLAFAGGMFQRSHDRKLSRYDRGFEIKLERYDAYSSSVNSLINTVTAMHERGNSNEFAPWSDPDVPWDIMAAYHELQVVAPLRVRNGAIGQFRVIQGAMEGDAGKLFLLREMLDELVLDMQHDLDLNHQSWAFRLFLHSRRALRNAASSIAAGRKRRLRKKKIRDMTSLDLTNEVSRTENSGNHT